MDISAIEIVQNGTKLYLTVIPAARLADSSNVCVDVYRPHDAHQGYQRRVISSRAKDYARYLRAGQGLSPSTVLLNLRGEIGGFQPLHGGYGRLSIPDEAKFWIVDGQHRIEGLRTLVQMYPEFGEYPMPVILMNTSSEYEEAKQFIIINKTQKGVSPDLAERFIARMAKREGVTSLMNLPRTTTRDIVWRPRATEVVDVLNEGRDDEPSGEFHDNPWFARIQLPNEDKGNTLVSQKAFEDSLRPALSSPLLAHFDDKEVAIILVRYWKAVLSICKDAALDPKGYVLQRTTGVNVLHAVLPVVLSFATRGGKRPTTDNLRAVLAAVPEGMTDEYWDNSGTAGLLGSSHKALSILTRKLLDAIEEGSSLTPDEKGKKPFEL